MDAPIVLGPGEGETIRPGFEIKVGRPELVLTESIYAPGQRGPDPHVHHDHVDSFWVLDGELRLAVGPELEERPLPAGGFALVPRDVLHSFHNPGPGEARFLNLHAPGLGFERYLRGDFPEFDQHYQPAGTGLAATEVVVLGPGEGERLELGESVATVKAGVEQLGVFEAEIGGDFPRPPAHRHLRTAESFYVLDGEFTVVLGGEQSTLVAGAFATVPPGTIHASAPSSGPIRFVNLFAPGGLEAYLREAAGLGERPDPAGFDIELA
jgi:mannose-6-phosphate isomerase-like protein (cupin superfamily)